MIIIITFLSGGWHTLPLSSVSSLSCGLSSGFLVGLICPITQCGSCVFWSKSLWLSSKAPMCRGEKRQEGPLHQFDLFGHSSKHRDCRQPGTSSPAQYHPCGEAWWGQLHAVGCFIAGRTGRLVTVIWEIWMSLRGPPRALNPTKKVKGSKN